MWWTAITSFVGSIFKPLGDMAVEWQKRKTVQLQAKMEIEKIRAEGQVKQAMKIQEQEGEYDLQAQKNMQSTWKDEYLCFIFTLPIIGCFIPTVQDYVAKGWDYVAKAPIWYQICLTGIVAATFGLRWWFKKTNASAVLGGDK